MNLRGERYYQKRMEVLDCLELLEENRKLAEAYLDLTGVGREELLNQVKIQDFSRLKPDKKGKSIAYVDHLQKRNQKEELKAYAEFMAAVGGSTAYYVLTTRWKMENLAEFLSQEQMIAMEAESIVWQEYFLNGEGIIKLFRAATNNPEIIEKAIPLCVHRFSNAKMLLIGILLFVTKPQKERQKEGLMDKLFPGNRGKEADTYQQLVNYLEEALVKSIPNLFPEPEPEVEEVEPLISFVRSQTQEQLSEKAVNLLVGKRFPSYLLTLLTGVAFLAIDHSKQFVNFIRLGLEMEFEITLSAGKKMTSMDNQWFMNHLELFSEKLDHDSMRYLRWGVKHQVPKVLQQGARRYRLTYWKMAREASVQDYEYLVSQAKVGNPELAEKIEKNETGRQEIRLINELAASFSLGTYAVTKYLMGEGKLETLYPFVDNWRVASSYYRYYSLRNQFKRMKEKMSELYERVVVLMALSMEYGSLRSFFNSFNEKVNGKKLKEEVEELLQIFTRKGLPVVYQADALGAVYDNSYYQEWKEAFLQNVVDVLADRYGMDREQIRQGAKEATATGRGICLRVMDSFAKEEKEGILAAALDSSKQVREILFSICSRHTEWEEDMLTLLSSKKMQERTLAIHTLKAWGAQTYQEQLKAALEKEKSKKLRELLEECLGEKVVLEEQGMGSGQDLTAALLKGGKARKVAWAFETPFSPVHTQEGGEAEEKDLQAILVAYADKTNPGISKEAKLLAARLKEEDLHRFAEELLAKWLEKGAEVKKKWVLYAASCHGGEQMVSIFWRQIQEWAQHSRGALAAEAVRALAFHGSAQALLQVDQIARKFKFRQVKAAAQQALESAAIELGISRQDLEDRIVPNLDFDERMERIFDYGTRSFRVYLTTTLELEILDEGGKRLKNLPAPAKKDEEEKAKAAYESFKQLKKQLKTVTTNQKQRLEYALSTERLWTSEGWRELFVKNPVMHQFAIGLIWGIYEEGKLLTSFRYLEDGSFTTCDEEELELPQNAFIGLVHPIELYEQALADWKEQLSDYEITQPIEQLERTIYRITEEEKEAVELTRFGGKLLNGLSLSGKLQGMGWYKGSVEDAGVYYTFCREDGEWGAELEFSGCYVAEENEEITVYGLFFCPAGKKIRRQYGPEGEKLENAYTLGEVNPRYFSEMILQLTRATASSQEQLPYPECKENQ